MENHIHVEDMFLHGRLWENRGELAQTVETPLPKHAHLPLIVNRFENSSTVWEENVTEQRWSFQKFNLVIFHSWTICKSGDYQRTIDSNWYYGRMKGTTKKWQQRKWKKNTLDIFSWWNSNSSIDKEVMRCTIHQQRKRHIQENTTKEVV